MTKIEFARAAHVNPSSITYGIAQGRVVAGADGTIDPEHPVNALYLARHSATQAGTDARRPVTPKGKRNVRTAPRAASTHNDEDDDIPDDSGPLAIRSLEAKINLANAQRDGHRMRQAERLGLLVHIDMVRKMIGALGSELKVGLADLPDRISAHIVATVRANNEHPEAEVRELLRAEIERILERVKEAAVDVGID